MPRLDPGLTRRLALLVIGGTAFILVLIGLLVLATPDSAPVASHRVYSPPPAAVIDAPTPSPSPSATTPIRATRPRPVVRTVPSPKPTPPPATAAPQPQLPANAGVFVLGDSLGEGTAPYLAQDLAGRPLTQSDVVGASLYAGLGTLRSKGASLPPIVVVSLGTNDVPTPSSFAPLVSQALATVGNRCVIWPDYVRPPTGSYNWDQANAVLMSFAASHPSMHIVPWSAMVRANPGWLASDGVHVNGYGYAARAEAIASAIAHC